MWAVSLAKPWVQRYPYHAGFSAGVVLEPWSEVREGICCPYSTNAASNCAWGMMSSLVEVASPTAVANMKGVVMKESL